MLDRGRVIKILGMLGSEHAGETLAAARLVEKLRHESGLTWSEILSAGDAQSSDVRDLYDQGYAAGLEAFEHELRSAYNRGYNAAKDDAERGNFARATPQTANRQEDIALCHAHQAILSGREREFVHDIARRHWPLTERQALWLDKILRKVRLHANAP